MESHRQGCSDVTCSDHGMQINMHFLPLLPFILIYSLFYNETKYTDEKKSDIAVMFHL